MTYDYQLSDKNINFEQGVNILKSTLHNKVVIGSVNLREQESIDIIIKQLGEYGVPVEQLDINKQEYKDYVINARYKEQYPHYYTDNFYEKTFEHFLSYKLLDVQTGDIFVDIGSEHSPLPEIFKTMTGCTSYAQDLMYEPGMHGHLIGGDAADMPVPDNFFTGVAVTCTLEHFEGDADIRFIKEMGRVLKPGGSIIIVPLYIYKDAACQTDPQYAIPGNVKFDKEATIFCAQGWGNRHARFYSPKTLYERLIQPNKHLNFTVYLLRNSERIDKSVYCTFFLSIMKA